MVNKIHTEQHLQAILQHFQIDTVPYTFQSIEQGYINATFFVLDKGENKFVLQRLNTAIFTTPKKVMDNISLALPYLQGEDYQSIALIKTIDQQHYVHIPKSGYWRLYTYIPNSYAPAIVSSEKMAYEAGKLLSNFHRLATFIPNENMEEVIPKFHDLQWRIAQFRQAVSKAKMKTLDTSKSSIAFVEATIPVFHTLWKKKLPIRLCHNDAKLNNMLFDKNRDKALCFIDLDTLMRGHFLYDYGDAVRTIVNATPEDEINLDLVTFNKALFNSFLEGMVQTKISLTQEEKDTLHLGIPYMPFLHGLRALTDYLEGNIYYKVTYEDQNLDRCKNLFRFVEIALGEMETIKDMIRKILQ